MTTLRLTYTQWKAIKQQNINFVTCHQVDSTDVRIVYTGNATIVYRAVVDVDDLADWQTNFESKSTLVQAGDDAHSLILGTKLTNDNVLRVSTEAPEGSRKTFITPNWCDKTTWYYKAAKSLGVPLTDSGDQLTFNGTGPWVDNYHGKYTNEDFLTTEVGDVPRMKVYVNTIEKTEVDPHTNIGDYTVDYANGTVTFAVALLGSDTITADIWAVSDSTWVLKPATGKKLKIISVEAQFSTDISLRDTVKFQPYGYVEVYAPSLTPTPYPAGTLIPLGNPTTYKTMNGFIDEANGAMPVIYKTTNPSPSWRDLTTDVQTFPWNYQAVTELTSSSGLEIQISLEHDSQFDGDVATATFYCLSYDE